VHSLEEARGWIGARVDDVYGSRVGEIVDVYVDAETGEVHWMLVRIGAADGPLTLVPVQYSIANRLHVWVPITKQLITRAPGVPGADALHRDDELELCFHYGGLRGRTQVLRQLAAGAATAVPGSSVARP
jgi:hypothetical protein